MPNVEGGGPERSDLLKTTATSYLNSIHGLKIEQDDPNATEKQVLRITFLPIALHLIDIGHNFAEDAHTLQGFLAEIIKYREDLSIAPEVLTQIGQDFTTGDVDWMKEADKISSPREIHPLKKLATSVRERMSPDAMTALAKLSV